MHRPKCAFLSLILTIYWTFFEERLKTDYYYHLCAINKVVSIIRKREIENKFIFHLYRTRTFIKDYHKAFLKCVYNFLIFSLK